jgi:hypothetical protein
MPKNNRHANLEREAIRDKIWTAIAIIILLVIIGYSIYIQIIHH